MDHFVLVVVTVCPGATNSNQKRKKRERGGKEGQIEMNRRAGAEVIDINLIPSSHKF